MSNAKIDKSYALFIKKPAIKAERYKWRDKQKVGLFNMSGPGAGRGIVCKTGILLVIETTWEFHNAAWLVCYLDLASFVRQLNCRTGRPKYGVLKVREN